MLLLLTIVVALACNAAPPVVGVSSAPLLPLPNVLLAEKKLTIGPYTSVSGGDVVVRQIEPLPPDGPAQLVIGNAAHVGTDAGCTASDNLIATSVTVGSGACAGDLQTSSLTNNGGTVGSQSAFPVAPLPPLAIAPLPVTGAVVDVASNTTLALAPGTYGDVRVRHGATLQLSTGSYQLASVHIDDTGTLTTTAAAVSVTVSGDFVTGRNAIVQPGASLTAGELDITAGGTHADVGRSSTITAVLTAPRATLTLEQSVVATGAFAGFNITVGDHVTVTFQDGLPQAPVGTQLLSGYYGQKLDGSFGATSPVPAATNVVIDVGLPLRNAAALQTFLHDVSDPTSPTFRQFISPATFDSLYGATADDYALLLRWAGDNGLIVLRTFPDNLLVTLSGTAAQVEHALYTNLIYREDASGAQTFVAVDREPSLDLTPTVDWVGGVNDWSPVTYYSDCEWTASPFGSDDVTGQGLGPWEFTTEIPAMTANDIREAYLGVNTGCSPLTGAGETVGILEGNTFNQSDIDAYVAAQSADVTITSNPPTLVDIGGLDAVQGEATLDIQAVMAMAPEAHIIMYRGSQVGHEYDDTLMQVATDNLVTVFTSSLAYAANTKTQQALEKMASQGISVFQAAGDSGDEGDPDGETNNRKMDNQTLVGGTELTLGPVAQTGTRDGKPIYTYTPPYHLNETTWNQGCSAFTVLGGSQGIVRNPLASDITGGGIMDGVGLGTPCFDPANVLCGPIAIPDYQANTPGVVTGPLSFNQDGSVDVHGGNGASASFRNFPDVAISAAGFQHIITPDGGSQRVVSISGTSLSAPLWAGFAALAAQRAHKRNVLPPGMGLGFLNRTLYAIGGTKGQSQDLYTQSFHDIADGVNNQGDDAVTTFPNNQGLGHASVVGYDLTTGWGSPTCGLLDLISSSTPLSPQVTFSSLVAHVSSGTDGVNDESSIQLTLHVNDVVWNFPLKPQADVGWKDGGTAHVFSFALPMPITQDNVTGAELTLFQNGQGGITADNWDVGGLQVELTGASDPNVSSACTLDLSGNGDCDHTQPSCNPNGTLADTSDTGVVRLSENDGCGTLPCSSGQGGIVFFGSDPLNGRCPAFAGTGAITQFDHLEFVIGTGDDDLRADSELDYAVFDSNNGPLANGALHMANSEPLWDNYTEHGAPALAMPISPMNVADASTIRLQFTPGGGVDEWHMESLQIYGRSDNSEAGQYVCLFKGNGTPEQVFNSGSSTLTVTVGSGCP